jgi:SAM-dependent methyltransferase
MVDGDDRRLVESSASRLYGDGQAIWDSNDRWNAHKRAEIDRFCRAHSAELAASHLVLDAGCGSQAYDWLPPQTISLDRFWKQAVARRYPVAADLRALPFADGTFEAVICVASVLNYVDAIAAIAELARVSAPGGRLLIHFETSTSFEHLGGRRWGDPAVRLQTINGGKPDSIWIYRPSFLLRAMEAAGLRVLRVHRFHILSALGLRLGLPQQLAAPLAGLDLLAGSLGSFSDDLILLAERRGRSVAAGAGAGRTAQ